MDFVPGVSAVNAFENLTCNVPGFAGWQQTFLTNRQQGALVAIQLLLVAMEWWKGFVRSGVGRLCRGL